MEFSKVVAFGVGAGSGGNVIVVALVSVAVVAKEDANGALCLCDLEDELEDEVTNAEEADSEPVVETIALLMRAARGLRTMP